MKPLFGRDPYEEPACSLYRKIVVQARQPGFFRDCGLPDTLDGRFDLLVLHVFLVLRRLKRDREETADLAQALFDALFRDMDESLREMGAGDMGVGRRVKRMAEAFYGRVAAYEEALASDAALEGAALEDAVGRNLFAGRPATPDRLAALADYIRREAAALDDQETAALLRGELVFGAAPGPASP